MEVLYIYIYIHTHICIHVYIYIYIHIYNKLQALVTNEIGTPEAQLEPQITSLEKCKID